MKKIIILLLISLNGFLFSNSAKEEFLKKVGLRQAFQNAANMKTPNPSYVIKKTKIHEFKPELFKSQKALDEACSSIWNYLVEYRESFRHPLPEFESLLRDATGDLNTAAFEAQQVENFLFLQNQLAHEQNSLIAQARAADGG